MEPQHKRRFIIAVGILLLLPLIDFDAPAQRRKKPPTTPQVKKPPAPELPKKPITKGGLLDALRIGGLSSRELVQEITSRGVSFEVSGQTETELRVAGAPTAVIDAARSNYRPLIGQLNVTVSVPGTEIIISGVGSYSNQITGLKLPPGRYTITVNKSGHRNATTEAEIKPSEVTNITLKLEPLTAEELLTLAQEAHDRKNYPPAISIARSVLAKQPENAKANALLASSLYLEGLYDESINYFVKAIALGESTRIPVLHRHGGSGDSKSLCSGRLTFQRDSIEFYSIDFPDEGFTIPYSKVTEMSVKDEMRLSFKARIVKQNRKETNQEYSFYATDAVATGKLITCPQCLPRMRLVLQLLKQLKTGSKNTP